MNIIKTILSLSIVASACLAQINISGTITDTGGQSIPGAAVMLEKHGYADTTAYDGSFTISGAVGINGHIEQSPTRGLSASINKNRLFITIVEKSAVKIAAYNLQGKLLYKKQATMDAGTHSMALPLPGAGVYIYRVITGCDELILKSCSIVAQNASSRCDP